MNSLEIKMARKTISSPEYGIRRMERLHREIAHWMQCEAGSRLSRYREYCRHMRDMNLRRYEYYAKKQKEVGKDRP